MGPSLISYHIYSIITMCCCSCFLLVWFFNEHDLNGNDNVTKSKCKCLTIAFIFTGVLSYVASDVGDFINDTSTLMGLIYVDVKHLMLVSSHQLVNVSMHDDKTLQ